MSTQEEIVEYVPLFSKQLEVHRAPPHSKILFTGGVGFGKTRTLGDFLLQECCSYPDGQVICFGATRPSMKLATIPKVLDEITARNVWVSYKDYLGEVHFSNGSWFKFQSLDVSIDELAGSELSALAGDEVSGCDRAKVETLIERVRKSSPVAREYNKAIAFGLPTEGLIKPGDSGWWDYSRRVLLCCNPPEPGHWLEDKFLRRDGDTREPSGIVIQASTYDNPLLPKDYIKDLERQYPPGSFLHKRRLLGLFGIPAEGAVYDIFNPEVHLVSADEVPTETKLGLNSIDLGSGGQRGDPFVFLCGVVDKSGNIFVTGEHYSREGLTLAEHAHQIRRLYKGGPIFCDYDSRDRLELAALGIRTIPATKPIMMGIHAVRARLARNSLFIVKESCPNLLMELPFYSWADGDKLIAARGDHALDALRYMVAGLDLPRWRE